MLDSRSEDTMLLIKVNLGTGYIKGLFIENRWRLLVKGTFTLITDHQGCWQPELAKYWAEGSIGL